MFNAIQLILLAATSAIAHSHSFHKRSTSNQGPILAGSGSTINSIPYTTRLQWMRRANAALLEITSTPCPFAAFGTVIVNHTGADLGSLGVEICTGANANSRLGNPTLHGEMAAINNCSEILQGPKFNLTPTETLAAFKQLTLYTNAESCPMCASAIRWAGFKEYVFGSSIDTLIEQGWGQIRISSYEIFEKSADLGSMGRVIGEVGVNETDAYFGWQFDPSAGCPEGCARGVTSGGCVAEGG